MHETNHFLITYGNVTGSFVSYVYLMLLFYQAAEGSTHGDNVVIRMRREDNHTFRIRFGTFRTVGIISIRFATRPSGDGMLQVIENLDIYIVSRTKQCQKFAQTVFVVVLVGQLQNRFACQLAQPYDSAADQFIIPLAGCYQPWTLDAC